MIKIIKHKILSIWQEVAVPSWALANMNLKRDYSASILGLAWPAIRPLPQIIVISFVINKVSNFAYSLGYFIFIYTNITTWNFITNIISSSPLKFRYASYLKRSLIKSQHLTLSHVFVFSKIYITALAPIILYSLAVQNYFIFLLPLYIILLAIVLFCISYCISTLTCYVIDIAFITELLMMLMFWLTPVIYPLEKITGKLYYIMKFNPFYIIMQPITSIIYYKHLPTELLHICLITVILISIVVTIKVYKSLNRKLVYHVI